jgi:hypothetical protein
MIINIYRSGFSCAGCYNEIFFAAKQVVFCTEERRICVIFCVKSRLKTPRSRRAHFCSDEAPPRSGLSFQASPDVLTG